MSTDRECAQCNWVMDRDDVDLTVATMVSDILQQYSRDPHKTHGTNRSGAPARLRRLFLYPRLLAQKKKPLSGPLLTD